MSVIDWLTGWFTGAASLVAKPIVDMVHWAVHALASVVLAVFDHVFGEWRSLASWSLRWIPGLRWLLGMIAATFRDIKRVIIPYVMRWVRAGFASVERFIHWVLATALAGIHQAREFAQLLVSNALKWVVAHVFAPLWAWVQRLYHLILTWAYVAWWWVTHLDALADALLLHLVGSLERSAWDVAGKLGRFALALVTRNLARFLQLAESIIAAVL
jgi:hypothetical protein